MNERSSLSLVTLCCVVAAGCGGESESPKPSRSGTDSEVRQTRQLDEFGAGQTEAYRIAEGVFQAHGVGNTNLVVTSEGNVVIDAGLPTTASDHRSLLRQASDAPTRVVVATHAHADHAGGAGEWIEDGTQVIAHRSFLDVQHYLTELIPYFMPRNKIFYPDSVPDMPSAVVNPIVQWLYPRLEPTVLVDDRYDFELGGVRFEVLHTPGAEGPDSISVWLPQQKILFTGDFFGPLFPMWPNLYTIRGEMLRFSMPYIHSLERVIALEPEILVPSHFEPIRGKERIRADLVRMRDAVRYVHDAVVLGMNEGKDVYTLMNEVALPPELELSQGHGKVSWGVRAIWEGYTGWFHESTVDLYAVPARAVHPEVVEMAGGAGAVAARARARVEAGEPVEALHLVDMALAADPGNRAALAARLAALELLLVRSGDVNHSEVYWLRHRIEATREELARAR
jgi:alkyl sulfatase BDS1-like metallo-beta-lactamase superfamily hydrolase